MTHAAEDAPETADPAALVAAATAEEARLSRTKLAGKRSRTEPAHLVAEAAAEVAAAVPAAAEDDPAGAAEAPPGTERLTPT